MRTRTGADQGVLITAATIGLLVLAGCGNSSTPTPASRTTPAAVAGDLKLNDQLRGRIQRNVARRGSPVDTDRRCRSMKLRYGPTANVARDHSEQIARQLHTLCPQYFVAL